MSGYPTRRLRRMRRTEGLRGLVQETRLHPSQFVYPMFVVEEAKAAGTVPSMPGIERYSVDSLSRGVDVVVGQGIRSIILFGVPTHKDNRASSAYDERGIVQQAILRVRKAHGDLVIMTDVCLCQFTAHGHCGVLKDDEVDNDTSLELIAKTAVSHAAVGADVVAPSGMMDGAVGAIRAALDKGGFKETAILAYAVKYASAFYGPFRDAAESSPKQGNRRAYQMDPSNAREALAEASLDIEEGADVVMVKPAMPYLDIIRRVREAHADVPIAAYQVSGEYSMLKAAAKNGWLDERATVLESLTSIKRAGADMILTYFAKEACGWINA